jgi:hypothetical protein
MANESNVISMLRGSNAELTEEVCFEEGVLGPELKERYLVVRNGQRLPTWLGVRQYELQLEID